MAILKQFDELVEGGLLTDIDAVATANNWRANLPQALIDATTRQGKMFAAPVNIHGQNWLFYNKELLAKVGAKEPRNWDEAIEALDKIKASGAIPLAFSGAKNWERLLFNAVLVDKGGPAIWSAFWAKRDPAVLKSPELRKAADTYKKLKDYTDPGASSRVWNDATGLVIQGKAGMQIMGDWAKGEFSAAGKAPEKDYGCVILASGSHGFIFGGDVFAFPKLKDANAAKAQALLAKTMLDPQAQIEFSLKKGSLPVRSDVDLEATNECMQKGLDILATGETVPAVEQVLSQDSVTQINDLMTEFFSSSMSAEDAQARFVDIIASAD